MSFGTAPKGGRSRVLGKHVKYDRETRRWVSTPIRVYVGPKALEVSK